MFVIRMLRVFGSRGKDHIDHSSCMDGAAAEAPQKRTDRRMAGRRFSAADSDTIFGSCQKSRGFP